MSTALQASIDETLTRTEREQPFQIGDGEAPPLPARPYCRLHLLWDVDDDGTRWLTELEPETGDALRVLVVGPGEGVREA